MEDEHVWKMNTCGRWTCVEDGHVWRCTRSSARTSSYFQSTERGQSPSISTMSSLPSWSCSSSIASCPVLITGDFNIHLYDPRDVDTIKFNDILDSFVWKMDTCGRWTCVEDGHV